MSATAMCLELYTEILRLFWSARCAQIICVGGAACPQTFLLHELCSLLFPYTTSSFVNV